MHRKRLETAISPTMVGGADCHGRICARGNDVDISMDMCRGAH